MSAYNIGPKQNDTVNWDSLLPKTLHIDGSTYTFNVLKKKEQPTVCERLYEIFADAIEEGETYPQRGPVSYEDFLAYYCSHDAFVLLNEGGLPVGSFYVKPNFPGRSSHICNAGFLVHRDWSGKGIGGVLADQFEVVAPLLGFQAAFFNLVYVNNEASIRLWERRGYSRTGTVPKAGFMKSSGLTDAYQYYKEFKVPDYKV